MQRTGKIILASALLILILIAVIAAFLLAGSVPTLTVVANEPVTQVEFTNPSGTAMNFFYFVEMHTNGHWVKPQEQPKGARGANHVAPHSKRVMGIAPTPVGSNPWRVGVSYQRAGNGRGLPWYLKLAEKLGVFKKARDEYFAFTTVYAELNP